MIDQNPSQTELDQALELIFYAQRAITAEPDAMLAQYEWGRVHHRILYFVARYPGITQQALLGILGVSKQALHGPMKQLSQAGLIVSKPAGHDRRARCLTLTPTGIDLEQSLSNPQRQLLARVFQSLGNSVTVNWVTTMQALSAHLRQPPRTEAGD
ncbi:MarR family winged helix-turn-helix transcriptional regulator [Chitinilyticum piscinae]|uniref:Winged helix-turn-helix transcriptional regulator n=1 Tax=Chitinilyticum piscinae TaxID=2866724 RepID=A0A8J7KB37_9NEIS|nr:MarR family winged helix-turn-helix transcriptional regulator [Chitinilyticum piscinae]MBE9609799.1 winged helix-turn-helix transcriptional regulator [Chitinilyticum piscinae]